MRKVVKFLAVVMTLVLLVACGEKGEEIDPKEPTNQKVEDDLNEKEEKEDQEGEVDEDEPEEETPTFADEVMVFEINDVLIDQEKTDFESNILIEHDNNLYVEQDYITSKLDYEVTFNDDSNLIEVFKGKGDYKYTPNHIEDEGAAMEIVQVYDEKSGDYVDVGDKSEDYSVVEFDEKLYLPVALIDRFMEKPVHHKRRDGILELGVSSERVSIHDVAVDKRLQGSKASATINASDVTIEGTNYEKGLKLEEIYSLKTKAYLTLSYRYSTVEGFLYNKSEDLELQVSLGRDDGDFTEEFVIPPRGKHELKMDVSGYGGLFIVANTTKSASVKKSDLIFIADFY